MIRNICTDRFFLMQPSEPATAADLPVAQDLRDTLAAHRQGCVGMAANMIGYTKRIIVINNEGTIQLMFNPEVIEMNGLYPADEYCICLERRHTAKRYETIVVKYQDEHFQEQTASFSGFLARIVQHQIDHCNSLVI